MCEDRRHTSAQAEDLLINERRFAGLVSLDPHGGAETQNDAGVNRRPNAHSLTRSDLLVWRGYGKDDAEKRTRAEWGADIRGRDKHCKKETCPCAVTARPSHRWPLRGSVYGSFKVHWGIRPVKRVRSHVRESG